MATFTVVEPISMPSVSLALFSAVLSFIYISKISVLAEYTNRPEAVSGMD